MQPYYVNVNAGDVFNRKGVCYILFPANRILLVAFFAYGDGILFMRFLDTSAFVPFQKCR